jgi:hypothetical protein
MNPLLPLLIGFSVGFMLTYWRMRVEHRDQCDILARSCLNAHTNEKKALAKVKMMQSRLLDLQAQLNRKPTPDDITRA